MIYTHIKTNKKYLLKKTYKTVGRFYVLDENNNRIPNGTTIHLETSYEARIIKLDKMKKDMQ